MKAIIIEEERFAELAEALRFEATKLSENSYLCKSTNLTKGQMKFAADEMFRTMNFVFVRWAQSHGASCCR